MPKQNNNYDQVLNLQEINEVQQEKKSKKNKILPTILLCIGIILIIIGFFYKDIIKLISNNDNKEKKETIVKDENKLTCNNKISDNTLGVSYTTTIIYLFNNKLLKNSETILKIVPLPNSDIAEDNIKVLSGQYLTITDAISKVAGITISTKLNNNILTVKYTVDYQKLDFANFPPNDKITINNKLDETSSQVKRKIQQNNYLCQ